MGLPGEWGGVVHLVVFWDLCLLLWLFTYMRSGRRVMAGLIGNLTGF
jgi:hypothetical protein